MAYIPTEWHAGDPIDKKKLMKIENELAVLAENLTALGVPEITSIEENSVTIDTNTVSIDSIQGILLYGTTTQNGTPSPDNPIDITPLAGYDTMTGSGAGATYSRSNEYDPLDDQYYAIQISDGTNTAWIGTTEKIAPLYDGDTIDFIAGQVIRNNDVETLAIADMDNNESYPGWKGDWEKYNGSGSNKEMFTTKGNYSSIGAENMRVCRISNTDGALYRPYGVLNNRTQSQWIELYPNLVITFVLKLTTAVTENVTINSSFPNLTGELTISSTGKLSIKFFPNLKNYIDNQIDITPAVSSVNGKTGEVMLSVNDINAAPAINLNGDSKYTFSPTEIAAKGECRLIIPTSTGVEKEYIAYKQDLLPSIDALETTDPTVTHVANTNSMVINGTLAQGVSEKYIFFRNNGSASLTPTQEIHAGDVVTLIVYKNKNITTTSTKPIKIEFYFNNTDSTVTYNGKDVGKNKGFDILTFTAQKDASTVSFYARFEADCSYDNVTISWAAILNGTFIEKNLNSDININYSDINSTGITMVPVNGYLRTIIDTKTYIDGAVSAVTSVNGKSGNVILDSTDVGAANEIVSYSDLKHTFSPTEINAASNCVLIIPFSEGITKEHIAYKQDLFPSFDALTRTADPAASHSAGTNKITIDGVVSDELYFYFKNNNNANMTPTQQLQANDVITVAVHKDKDVTGTTSSDTPVGICLYLKNSDETTVYQYNWMTKLAGTEFLTWTLEKDVNQIGFYLVASAGCEFSEVTFSWGTIVNGSFIESNLTNDIKINKSLISTNGITMLPANGYLKNIEDTKTYIDTHVPSNMLLEEDLIYVSPEMYGAVGNGSNDDTTAVQNCINYAKIHNVPVRGFQKYRVTSTININARDLDVHLGKIIRSGAGAAVKISGKFNKFTFHEIEALSTGGIGIDIANTLDYDATERNRITGDMIYAENASITFGDDPSGESYIMYTVLDIKTLYSQNLHCIYCNRSRVTETSLYNAYFACQNGWCIYGTEVHLYNSTIEANCYGGVYAPSCQIYGGRIREMEDALMPANPHHDVCSGILFKYMEREGRSESDQFRIKILVNDTVYYDAIDLSEYTPHSTRNFYNGAYGIIDNMITYGDANYTNGYVILGKRMYIHGDKKICEPLYPSEEIITTTPHDMSDSAGNHYKFSTRFIIDIASCVITLSPSYTASGINEFEIIQYDSTKLATVYDCEGNKIFDPTVYGVGRYKISAIVDYNSDPSIENMSPQWPANNENMNIWTVEKIVSAPCTNLLLSNNSVIISNLAPSTTLTPITTPANTSDYIVWKSSNPSVVKVYRGQLTFVTPGTATITAYCGSQTATCTVASNLYGEFTRLVGIWTTCDSTRYAGGAGHIYFWPSSNRGTILSSIGSLKINNNYIDDKTNYYPYPLPASTSKVIIDTGESGLLLDCIYPCSSTIPATGTSDICSAIQWLSDESGGPRYEITIPTYSSDLPQPDSVVIVLKTDNDITMTEELLNQVVVDFE